MFFGSSGSGDPDPSIIKRKYSIKKNLDFYCYVTSLWVLSLKTDVNVPSKSKKQKNLFFVDILKATDEKSRIRIQNVTDPQHRVQIL
jgi:hypothetical protein